MLLRELAVDAAGSVEFAKIALDIELVRDVQGQLSIAGLLDPPVDGKWGAVSQWALSTYLKRCGLDPSRGITREAAASLSTENAGGLFGISTGESLASRAIAALQRRGYWVSRYPKCFNIVYLEGMNVDGTANANKPDEFNDSRLLIRIDSKGEPTLEAAWDATTEPGRHYTEQPMEPDGAARIAFGQYKSWVVGTHLAGRPSGHEALVQADQVAVYRDLNKDYSRAGDKKYTGVFGINQHWGYDLPKGSLANSSAGCLVGRTKDGHREFMKLLKSDPRYRASKAYRFVATILPVSALSETDFDPSMSN
jgi:hypothetical protein